MTSPRSDRRARARRRARRWTLTAALTVGALLVGGTAWAYWTATATGTGTVASHTVAVTQSDFSGLATVYKNHVLTSTGSFTVTNSGQTGGSVTASISASGSLASSLPVRAWQVASLGACTAAATVPTGAASGTWASVTLPAVTIAAGQNAYYCVRTTAASRQSLAATSGTQSVTPTVSVVLDDDEGWVGTRSLTASATLSTELIYPYPAVGSTSYLQTGLSDWFTIRRAATTTLCLDVSGSGAGGTNTITYTCHNDPNQRWQIVPATDVGANLVRIRPKHESGLATSLTAGSSNQVTIAASSTSSAAQLWELQRISTTTFQLVAQSTGYCLTMNSVSADTVISTSPCDTSTTARANQVLTLNREPLTCSDQSGWLTGRIARIGFSTGNATNTGTSKYRAQRGSGTSWTNGAVTAAGATSIDVELSGTGPTTWRIVIDGTPTNVASTDSRVLYTDISITGGGSGFTPTATCTAGIG